MRYLFFGGSLSNKPRKKKKRQPQLVRVAKNPDCDHEDCGKVYDRTKRLMFTMAKKFGLAPQDVQNALKVLPRLLCTPGAWPPENVTFEAYDSLFLSFVTVCSQTGIKGLRGQEFGDYSQLALEFADTKKRMRRRRHF